MYIEINITKDMLNFAKDKISTIKFNKKELNKFGSEKTRTFFGYIGQAMILSYIGIPLYDVETFDYDVIFNNKKWEIKSISCKYKPPLDFLATVNSHDLKGVHKQKSDYYIFNRILYDKTIGWILGYISCDDFFKKGEFKSKGENICSNPSVGKFEKANATVLPISKLHSFKDIKLDKQNWLKGRPLFL